VLGVQQLINHADAPNCRCEWEVVDGQRVHKVSTVRDVKAAEELTFDYEVPLWFNPALIKGGIDGPGISPTERENAPSSNVHRLDLYHGLGVALSEQGRRVANKSAEHAGASR
jgi:SET domain-containing protein